MPRNPDPLSELGGVADPGDGLRRRGDVISSALPAVQELGQRG